MKNIFPIFLWMNSILSFHFYPIKKLEIWKLKMSEEEKIDIEEKLNKEEKREEEEKIDEELSKFFELNRLVNYGRSVDEDGKSNIWGMEPKMIVEENGRDERDEFNINLLVLVSAIMGSAISLPLFLAIAPPDN